MTGPFFLVVDEHTARNPVARALARNSMASAMRDFLIALYLLPDGSAQGANVEAAAKALTVAIRIKELDGEADSPDCRVMRGAMQCLVECSNRKFVWRTKDAPAVDAGLTRALQTVRSAPAARLHMAWAFVREMDRLVEADMLAKRSTTVVDSSIATARGTGS